MVICLPLTWKVEKCVGFGPPTSQSVSGRLKHARRANPSNLFLIRQRINEQFRLRNLFSPSRSGLRLGGFRAEVAKIRKRPKK